MSDKSNWDMNDIEKKRFKDAMKKAESDPKLDFFADFDPQLPPASDFMVDNSTKRHNRRVLYSLAPVAACVCIVFVVLFANGKIGAGSMSGSSSMDTAANTSLGTAGDDFSALYERIEAYQSELYRDVQDEMSLGVMSGGAVAAGADTNAPEAQPDMRPGADADLGSPLDDGGIQDDVQNIIEDLPVVNEEPVVQNKEQNDPDFSDTNEQVAGVREADIVKNDGKFIYTINSNNLSIVDISGDGMKLASQIPQTTVSDGQVYFEMFLAEDRLIAIRHGYNAEAYARMESSDDAKYEEGTAGSGYVEKPSCINYPIGGYYTDTSVDIFDISSRSNPKLLHSLSQSGDYRDSRMIDGDLYLITNYYGGDLSQIDENDPRTFVPLYLENGEQVMPTPDDIFLPGDDTWPSYTLISGIDAVGSGVFTSKKSLYGECGTVYCSAEAVYVTRTEYNYEEVPNGEFVKSLSSTNTIITKAGLNNGQVDVVAVESVPGVALNQFSLDEYKGVLRIVTTNDQNSWYSFRDSSRPRQDSDWDRLPESTLYTSNALYTLDGSLKVLGKVEDLAPEERVYSCRFMGDIAYFVTFRQTDPLFSVDLSNPSKPTVLDALKIPGFSEYLHPYADGELFGLGRDADAETGRQKGLKLTMFDNSNPADLKEKTTLLVENQDSYSSAETNHKAILINQSRSIIAFPVQQWEDAGPLSRYMIYNYDKTQGFSKVAEITIDTGELYNLSELRGLFIDDTFFVVGPNNIGAYAMNANFKEFAEKQILKIDDGASSVNRYAYYPPGVIMPLAGPVVEVVE